MSSSTLIGIWSYGIWENLGSPDCLNPLTISGYAVQPNTLGWLNSRIGTCYQASGTTGVEGTTYFDVTPPLTAQELALIGAHYMVTYYRHLSMATMGMGGDTMPWIRLREGDSTIERANPVNLGKEYREMAKDAIVDENYLVNAYINQVQGGSSARSVDFYNPPARITTYYGGLIPYRGF